MDRTRRIWTVIANEPRRQHASCREARWLAIGLVALALVATSCASARVTGSRSGCTSTPTPTSMCTPTPTAPPTPIPAPAAPLALTLDVRQAGATCPRDVAWSPDGKLLAVLATRGECVVPPSGKTPDLVLVYDVASGHVRVQCDLAALLTPAHALIGGIDYYGLSPLSWSPDGKTLAIPVVSWSTGTGDPDRAGLLLVPANGGAASLILGARAWVDSPDGITPGHVTSAPVWDVPTETPASQVPLPLPPSPSYGWVSPTRIAPSTSATAFSTWQPGVLAAIPVNANGAGFPVWEYYSSSATLWSPDGHSVASDVVTQYLVGASRQAPAEVNGEMCLGERLPLPCTTATLSAPDAAFAVAVARVKAAAESSDPPYPNRVPLAWRPGGGMLAAVLPGDGLVISLLDTADGRTRAIAQFSQQGVGGIGLADGPFFFWSPSGHQLAVLNGETVLVFDIS
ncbi:MAG: hypothetical protein ACLQUY_09675 [Ktedonobacterales bacterium]